MDKGVVENFEDDTKTPPTISITQRLWADLGRSVEVACSTGVVKPNYGIPTFQLKAV